MGMKSVVRRCGHGVSTDVQVCEDGEPGSTDVLHTHERGRGARIDKPPQGVWIISVRKILLYLCLCSHCCTSIGPAFAPLRTMIPPSLYFTEYGRIGGKRRLICERTWTTRAKYSGNKYSQWCGGLYCSDPAPRPPPPKRYQLGPRGPPSSIPSWG